MSVHGNDSDEDHACLWASWQAPYPDSAGAANVAACKSGASGAGSRAFLPVYIPSLREMFPAKQGASYGWLGVREISPSQLEVRSHGWTTSHVRLLCVPGRDEAAM